MATKMWLDGIDQRRALYYVPEVHGPINNQDCVVRFQGQEVVVTHLEVNVCDGSIEIVATGQLTGRKAEPEKIILKPTSPPTSLPTSVTTSPPKPKPKHDDWTNPCQPSWSNLIPRILNWMRGGI